MREETGVIRWRLHLSAPPDIVYRMLATADGRRRFWADSAEATGDRIAFRFPSGRTLDSRIVTADPPHRFAIEYFGGSVATFSLEADGDGGTDLTLHETGIPDTEHLDNLAGWVALLLTLKGAVDHRVDLRNGDPHRNWDAGYVDG